MPLHINNHTSYPPVCRSIIKSGRPLNEAGTPVLGHAQRAPAGEAPPHTITKELQVGGHGLLCV